MSSATSTPTPIPTPTLKLTVLAAEDLKNVSLMGKMNPYAIVWIDPYTKRSTRILKKGGKDPIWNDTMTIPVDAYSLQNPYACLNIQVLNHGPVWDTLVGSSWLPLSEIWRLRSLKESDADPDVITLQLHRPSGRLQGIVRVSVEVIGAVFPPSIEGKQRMGSFNTDMPEPTEGIPVMGYAVPYYSAAPFYAPSYSSASSSMPIPYPPPSVSSSFTPYQYIQPSALPPPVPPRPRRQGSGLLLGLLGGALGAILLGDLIF